MRDITSNPEWEKAYQYEIPVLAKLLSDGTEVSFFYIWVFLGFGIFFKKSYISTWKLVLFDFYLFFFYIFFFMNVRILDKEFNMDYFTIEPGKIDSFLL